MASADSGSPNGVAQRIDTQINLVSKRGLESEIREVRDPGASFIKLHFSTFVIPAGVVIEVSSPDGDERYFYWQHKRDAYTWDARLGDDGFTSFSAMSITGDTALVRVLGRLDRLKPGLHYVQIDNYLSGRLRNESPVPPNTLEAALGGAPSKPQTTCGINERYDAVCFKESHPAEYGTAKAIAVLITATGKECTAWRVGPDNRMFTAEHCIRNQDDVTGTEIWFNYQAKTCGSKSTENVVKVTGDQFLAANAVLDFGLFTVNDFQSIAPFGYLGLDVRDGSLGEGIFIPQHGLGRPAQIALESDMNSTGWCQIDSANKNGYGTNTDIGYYCDTTTSSSGSPVIAAYTGKVIALHHLGGCMNSGSKMKLIWPEVASHFGGKIPNGDGPWTGGQWADEPEQNQSPEAWFTHDCNGLECAFDGSGSADPDGSLSQWSWTLGDGAKKSGTAVSHTYAAGGTYSVKLVVTDDGGATDSITQTVTVAAANTPPTANFSFSCQANECAFDAGSSSDAEGAIAGYAWMLGDGTSASGAVVQHAYAAAGTYSVKLTVTDEAGATASKTRSVSVTMPNLAPEADFNYSCQNLACSFDGSPSSDPDGTISSWNWAFGDGQSAQGQNVSHDFASGGKYSVTLTVTDNKGASAVSTRTVSVAAQQSNTPPRAEFSYSCSAGACSFDGSASSDPDGLITSWDWSFGDGTGASGVKPQHTFVASGVYPVRLTVTDDTGADNTIQRSVSVVVEPANQRPGASFTFSCDGTQCQFDGSASRDADGHIERHDWNFGDGSSAEGAQVAHEFAKPGTYTVTLIVTDDVGYTASRSRQVVINDSPSISLKVAGNQLNGKMLAILKWSGAESSDVDIYRDGKLLARTVNNGVHIDKNVFQGAKKLRYRLCEQGSSKCSGEVSPQ